MSDTSPSEGQPNTVLERVILRLTNLLPDAALSRNRLITGLDRGTPNTNANEHAFDEHGPDNTPTTPHPPGPPPQPLPVAGRPGGTLGAPQPPTASPPHIIDRRPTS